MAVGADARAPAVLAGAADAVMPADARAPAVLALLPPALVLADTRPPALPAVAPDALVRADARAPAPARAWRRLRQSTEAVRPLETVVAISSTMKFGPGNAEDGLDARKVFNGILRKWPARSSAAGAGLPVSVSTLTGLDHAQDSKKDPLSQEHGSNLLPVRKTRRPSSAGGDRSVRKEKGILSAAPQWDDTCAFCSDKVCYVTCAI